MSLFSRVTPPSTRLIGSVAGRLSRVTRGTPRTGRGRKGQAGQALPLFVLMIFVLTGSVAVVTDVSWFWVNQQKMQRAADAGALAGAVFLPGDPSGAYAAARAATARNGYTDGVGGVLVTPAQEAQNRRRLDVSVAGPIGTYFARVFGMNQADYSGAMGTPGHSGLTDCSANTYHNAWYTLASGLAAGRYRMNVTTSSANNLNTNAENMWSAWVTSSGSTPQVYGEAKMVAYNNLVAGTQLFYLAQIDASNAGKTMEISLFDPGDVSGDAFLRIKSPDGNAYNYANFSWTADDGTSGNNVTSIQTASAGGSLFNDRLITIDVPLPNTYGTVGLTPAGEASAGWWKIEY